MTLVEKIFGTHSERELKVISKEVDKIEALRDSMMQLSDDELKAKTTEFKERLANGETLDDILVEAYAVVREAGRRVLNMEHYRVQLMGGIVLHQGRIAEMRTGEGKAVDVNTRIPTPSGWKRAGDIKVGDTLFDRTGKPTTVTGVYPQGEQDVYEVVLKDGRSIRCNEEHLWTVYENYKHNIEKTKWTYTTRELLDRGIYADRGYRFALPMNEAVEYAEKDLEVDPYVLGCFLGDGCSGSLDKLMISSSDEEIVAEIARLIGATSYKKNSDYNFSWTFRNGIHTTGNNRGRARVYKGAELSKKYAKLLTGTRCYDKYIPDEYKLGSIEQRWALIQGLMDTDGNIYKDESNRYNIQYSTTSAKLRDDIMEVLYSLGCSCTWSLSKEAGSKEHYLHDQYTVRANVPNEIKYKFFRLSRKKEIATEAGNFKRSKDYSRISIVEIRKLREKCEQVCFTVDNFEHLFLVGNYIVTHNTLVCTLPAYLNALDGKGVHVVTVNDYLAKRDADEMGQLHRFLGLSVGCVLHDLTPAERKAAYDCDITYITNNELGFDYLRDNMAINKNQLVQRGLHYAIIDEIDSILIDEARTPLIISGQGNTSTKIYELCDYLARQMVRGEYKGELSKMEIIMGESIEEEDGDFIVDEKDKVVTLTEAGVHKVEKFFRIDNLADIENTEIQHNIELALRANNLMHRDKDYVVSDDGEILIVDEFTGRIMPGRRFSDGLHQAIEAKEKVKIKSESKTLATITFQNFFNKYDKKGGMTGTALTEEREFRDIYELDVIVIPTNKPVQRIDHQDAVYKTKNEKYRAVVSDVRECYVRKQPVLVGTISIEVSELLSGMLKRAGVPHQVLNAKLHAKEAEIVALAGQKGAVTIATNMAGRGTDIKLGDGVAELGGLKIIGTERHESRRIDNQLRGRSGRQGDPGEAKFYISLEDDLMRLFGSEKLIGMFRTLGIAEGEELQHKMLSSAIEKAQLKIETNNYGIRKNLIDYDIVNNEQREIIYKERMKVLNGDNMKDTIIGMMDDVINDLVDTHLMDDDRAEWNIDELNESIHRIIPMEKVDLTGIKSKSEVAEKIKENALVFYNNKEAEFPASDMMREFERIVLLKVIDKKWTEHIDDLEHLRMGIGLQAYAQKDPKLEYRMEAYDMFSEMNVNIQKETITLIFRSRIKQKSE